MSGLAGRVIAVLAGAVAAAALSAATAPDAVRADSLALFTGTAVAQGMRVTIAVPRFLVTETLTDAGAPISRAELGTIGGRAFASALYPGDTAAYQQATAVLGLPPPPVYPVQVSATHPTEPKAEAAPAGQAMAAEAGPTVAAARAAAGGPQPANADGPAAGASLSTTRVEALPDGSVVARAESVVAGASFPGGLRIGRVRSVVTATLAPGGTEPAVETATTITAAEVAGTTVEIGPDGLTAPQPTGLPAGSLQPIDDTLAKAGITVRRVSGATMTGGASSDAIEVTSAAAPVPGAPGATVIYRLAGVTAAVVGAGLPPGSIMPPPVFDGAVNTSTGTLPMNGPGALPEIPAAPTIASPLAGGTVPPVSLPAGPVADPGAAASAPVPAGPEAAAPGSDEAALSALGARRVAGDLRRGLGLLYLVLILSATAAFAAASLLRRKGVQPQWNS